MAEPKDKRKRRLRDIELDEVSLVDMPAIQRTFLVVKNIDGGGDMEEMKFDDILESLGNVEDEKGDEKDISKALPEKTVKSLEDALKVISPFAKDLPDSLKKTLGAISKASAGETSEDEKEATEKAGRKLSKSTAQLIKSVIAALSKLDAGKAVKAAIKSLSSLVEQDTATGDVTKNEVDNETEAETEEADQMDIEEVADYAYNKAREDLQKEA